jgi:hypothetical protein
VNCILELKRIEKRNSLHKNIDNNLRKENGASVFVFDIYWVDSILVLGITARKDADRNENCCLKIFNGLEDLFCYFSCQFRKHSF